MDHQEVSNPFLGLRFFGTNDANLFFGRDGQTDELLRKLQETRFVAVVGPSGSGKSSLVNAGLVPALFGGLMRGGSHWRIAYCRPGNDPISNLARALNEFEPESQSVDNAAMQAMFTEVTLRRSSLGLAEYARRLSNDVGKNLLVIVDQFEELFRFRGARPEMGDEAAAFAKLLMTAAHQSEFPVYVVLTMRSDFLGDCAQFYGLIESINAGQYLIPRMTPDDRRMAITGPVALAGGEITPRLVNRLLNDIGDSPDQLPIMQHALMRTWDSANQRDPNAPLDLSDYEAIGGMRESLSRHADEAFAELTEKQQRLAEKIFKALTEKDERNYMWRRPASLSELCVVAEASRAEILAVIENFRQEGRSFLMPPSPGPLDDETIIDISHESLIRNWPRLRNWAEEEAQAARIYRRLAESAVLYYQGSEALLHDPALQLTLDWYEKLKPNRAWASRYHPEFENAIAFLELSHQSRVALIDEEKRRQEEMLQRDRRELEQVHKFAEYQRLAVKRLRVLTTALFGLFLLSSVATVMALKSRSDAVSARAETLKALDTARASEANAIAARKEAERQRALADDSATRLRQLMMEISGRGTR